MAKSGQEMRNEECHAPRPRCSCMWVVASSKGCLFHSVPQLEPTSLVRPFALLTLGRPEEIGVGTPAAAAVTGFDLVAFEDCTRRVSDGWKWERYVIQAHDINKRRNLLRNMAANVRGINEVREDGSTWPPLSESKMSRYGWRIPTQVDEPWGGNIPQVRPWTMSIADHGSTSCLGFATLADIRLPVHLRTGL
jgi:hypothetical protein